MIDFTIPIHLKFLLNSVVIVFTERMFSGFSPVMEFRGLITVHVINGILSLTHPTGSNVPVAMIP